MFFTFASFIHTVRPLWSSIIIIVVLLSLFTSCGKDKPKSEGGSTSSNTGGNTTDGGGTPTPTVPAPSRAYMWVTGLTYQGNNANLQNDASADAVCAARAAIDAASLPAGVTAHKAILARTGGAHPKALIDISTDIYRQDNTTIVVNDYGNFFDSGNISNSVDAAGSYWTGLDGTGIGDNCNGWTSNASANRGRGGFANQTNSSRYGNCAALICNRTCNNGLSLLCLSYQP